MGQLIQYLSTSSSSSCGMRATAPRVGQARATIAAGSGSAPTDLFTALTSGAIPYSGGQLSNPGCADVQLTISYLNGADCDSCTADIVTSVPVTVVVPAKSVFSLPEGLVTSIQYQTGSRNTVGVFTAANVTVAQSIEWYSSYQPCCDQQLVP
jgi:hypothetical protein